MRFGVKHLSGQKALHDEPKPTEGKAGDEREYANCHRADNRTFDHQLDARFGFEHRLIPAALGFHSDLIEQSVGFRLVRRASNDRQEPGRALGE
jgi:hypothetical protein